MPVSINSYKQIAQDFGVAKDTVHLSKAGDSLVVRGGSHLGRAVSWFMRFRSSRNTAVRQHFVDTLASQYGRTVTDLVVEQRHLMRGVNAKKALTARDISLAFADADQFKGTINSNNAKQVNRYHSATAEAADAAVSHLESKSSEVLSKMLAYGDEGYTMDEEGARALIDSAEVGEKIKAEIQTRGNDGKHQVSESEADGIATQTLRDAALEAHKATVFSPYLLSEDPSQDSKGMQLLSDLYQRRGMTLDRQQLSRTTVFKLNEKIEDALMNKRSRGRADYPALLSEAQTSEIVEHKLEEFVSQRHQALQSLETLAISDSKLKEEVSSFVMHTNVSPAQVKNAWRAGVHLQPHLKVICNADRATEGELKEAINGYMEVLPMLGDASIDENISAEGRQARGHLMLLAQGADRHSVTQELHRQITQPGPFRAYKRAVNHYRSEFTCTSEYAENEEFYDQSMFRVREFAEWTENLGLAAAELLGTDKGADEILSPDESLASPSEIDCRTLTLMRNTGIKMPTPDYRDVEGEGVFCDDAIKYMEESLAAGGVGPVEDDICQQFLVDLKRVDPYFNDEQTTKANSLEKLKAFCTDDNGVLDRNMLFAVTQIHQGTTEPSLEVCLSKQMGPVYGVFAGRTDSNYRFSKNDDGSIAVRVEYGLFNAPAISRPEVAPGEKHDLWLDSTKSQFEVALDLRLDPNRFTDERDHYIPPEVVNATYKYSLYTQDA